MKNKFLVGGIIFGMLFSATPVSAKGNATVEFTSENSVVVGDTFKVYMNVKDVENTPEGVLSLGGNIEFDETKLEYVSSRGVDTPYLFQINEAADYKMAGLDFTLENGIFEDTMIYEFTFKALEEGNTTITITNAKLTDSQDYMDTLIIAKEINIEEPQEIETPVIESEVIENNEIVEENNVVEEIPEEIVETEQLDDEVIEVEEEIVEIKETIAEPNVLERISDCISKLFKKILMIFR